MSRTFRIKRDAEMWARRTEDEMDRGLHVNRTEAERLTVESAMARYMAEVSPTKAPGTHRTEISKARHLASGLGVYSLIAVTSDVVAKYRDSRLKSASANQVRLELALLSHMFTVAMREWRVGLPVNPAMMASKPSPGRGRTRRLEPGEEERILDACARNTNPFLKWIVVIAIETAMRRNEILSLERSQVDMGSRTVFLETTKNGDSRTVPLTRKATATFQEALSWQIRPIDTDLIFFGEPGRDGKRRPYAINKVWETAKRRAGIEGLWFHDLRHEATSRMIESGMSDQMVSAITGHKSMQMLKRYTQLRAKDLVGVLDRHMV